MSSQQVEQIEISLAGIMDVEQLHALLMERLAFPHYYGKNWDAFWDVITEPDRLPCNLKFIGWVDFQSRLPEAARMLFECLRDAPAKYSYVRCRVEYI